MLIGRRSFFSDFARALVIPWVAVAFCEEPRVRRQLQFFSGRVEDLTAESIAVLRHLASRKNEMRTFVRTQETIVSGELEKGARVIVGFTTTDGIHVAHRVIVRR